MLPEERLTVGGPAGVEGLEVGREHLAHSPIAIRVARRLIRHGSPPQSFSRRPGTRGVSSGPGRGGCQRPQCSGPSPARPRRRPVPAGVVAPGRSAGRPGAGQAPGPSAATARAARPPREESCPRRPATTPAAPMTARGQPPETAPGRPAGGRACADIGQVPGQDRAQPGGELRLRSAPKLPPVLVGLQERLLDQVRRVELGPQPRVELDPRQEQEIVAVAFQGTTLVPTLAGHRCPLLRETGEGPGRRAGPGFFSGGSR